MSFEVGVRRSAPDDRPLPPSDPVLVEQLRTRIEAHGPITFAEFMATALTDPDHGYYATSDDRPTRSGDFLTAPELHPIFGAVLARALDECWRALDRPATFVVREFGAGSGALAEAILAGLSAGHSALLEALVYDPSDLIDDRAGRIRERLRAAGHQRVVDRRADHPSPGVVIANEFLDALPVHRVEWRDGRLTELLVGTSESDGERPFIEVAGEPSSPTLAGRLEMEGIVLAEGQRAEICLELDGWAANLAGAIDPGFVIVIDYGRAASELYGPARSAGTLRAYSGHRAHADPFVAIGRQDLTAHVDFTAVESALAAAGWHTLGVTTQAEFLTGSGLGELLQARQADPSTSASDYLALRSSVMRLLDPAALGAFRVLVAARGPATGTTRLSGLDYRLRR